MSSYTERELSIRAMLAEQAPGDDFLRFVRALIERDGDTLDVAYLLEKPWKWTSDYIAWTDAGEPDECPDVPA